MAWYDYNITQGFKWTDTHKTWHSGIDIGAPWNTAVTAPLAGHVVFAQCKPWGGQVDVLVSYSSQPYVVTFLHLHSIMVNRGQSVAAGQLLGYSGGDSRGPCPTQMPKYSDGPHIHFELTLGSVGPYHGGPPYKVTASSFTVDPTPLYRTLHQQEALSGAFPGTEAAALSGLSEALPGSASEGVSLPGLDTLFAIPQATVDAVNAIPGIDNLIYRLHDAETFPGWKSLDQVAPLASDAASVAAAAAGGIAGTIPGLIPGALGGAGVGILQGVSGAAGAVGAAATGVAGTLASNLNPGRLVYWIAGNLLGNARAGFVRLLYLLIGGMLFLALVIALGSAQQEIVLKKAEEVAGAVAPFAEMVA